MQSVEDQKNNKHPHCADHLARELLLINIAGYRAYNSRIGYCYMSGRLFNIFLHGIVLECAHLKWTFLDMLGTI